MTTMLDQRHHSGMVATLAVYLGRLGDVVEMARHGPQPKTAAVGGGGAANLDALRQVDDRFDGRLRRCSRYSRLFTVL